MSVNKLRDMIYTAVLLNLCAIVPRNDGVHCKQVWVPGYLDTFTLKEETN